MIAIRTMLRMVLADEAGATAVEYGLIASLIIIALIGGLASLGGGAGGMWTELSTEVQSVM